MPSQNKQRSKAIEKAREVLSKPIIMCDIKTHISLKEFPSAYQAAIQEFDDSNKASLITRCCKGKTKSAYGFYWKYK